MNIKVFSPRIDSRPEPDTRPDWSAQPRPAPRADRPARPDALVRRDRVRPHNEDASTDAPTRTETRTPFSSLLALLAGADGGAPTDVLNDATPPSSEALLDRLIDGSLSASAATHEMPVDDSPGDQMGEVSGATEALQYRIRRDAGTNAALNGTDDERGATPVGLATNAMVAPNGASGIDRPRRGAAHARLNEVLGRIVARRGVSVEELKARGEDQAADLRVAVDALLSQAGTPAGLQLADASERAALHAAMTALANATAASAADITTPVREVDGLAPALRTRLDRVIDRMKSEYGHDVSVVETVRSQARQDFLYEQGRTRGGAVVTWTRESAHLSGDAVDVLVDGSWSNAEGFGRLQRIAQEEGLRTLGVRDPGHLELPRDARRSAGEGALAANAQALPVARPLIANAPQPSGALASGVARVAGVAQTASVARIADRGSSRGGASMYEPTPAARGLSSTTDAVTSTIVGSVSSTQGRSADRGAQGTREEPTGDRRTTDGRGSALSAGEMPPAFGALQATVVTAGGSEAPSVAAPIGAQTAERVAELQQLRENAPAGSVSRMTINIDTPDGGQDRITVDLRGTTVDTMISTDSSNADRLRMRTAELQDALGRHGLDGDSVRISGSPRTDATDASRAASAERDGSRLNAAQQGAPGDGAANQGQRERAANAREWDRPESSRQSRDEQRESSKRGAGQPGQRDTHNRSER